MIVMFKLTPTQKQIALAIVERLKHPLNQPEADQMDGYLFLGNLRGYIPRTAETLNVKLVKRQVVRICETWGTLVDFDSWVTSKLIRLL